MKKPKQITFDDYRLHSGHGGPRVGAGRRARRPGVIHHVRRPPVSNRFPAHVTLRVVEGVPSLRRKDFIRDFRASLARACEKANGSFRAVHYSLQKNHVHLIVEATSKAALGRGMKSITTRLVGAARRVFGSRGAVLDGRYHLRLHRSPREVRHALAYVLLNVRKHWKQVKGVAPPTRLDQATSGRWFDGWRKRPRDPDPDRPREVEEPHTWLLSVGWRRTGLIDPAEVPGGSR